MKNILSELSFKLEWKYEYFILTNTKQFYIGILSKILLILKFTQDSYVKKNLLFLNPYKHKMFY